MVKVDGGGEEESAAAKGLAFAKPRECALHTGVIISRADPDRAAIKSVRRVLRAEKWFYPSVPADPETSARRLAARLADRERRRGGPRVDSDL